MRIIIPRLPKSTTKRELRSLVADVLDKRLHIPLTQRPGVSSCDILSIRDTQGVVEFHGLVTITPDQAGSWLLGHFKGQHLHQKLVLAREYLLRKQQGKVFAPEDDRRREGLDVTKSRDTRVRVEANDQFAQIHHG